MRLLPSDDQLEFVRIGCRDSLADADRPHRQSRPHVQAHDRINAVHDTFVDHAHRAGQPLLVHTLFRGLKQKAHLARKLACIVKLEQKLGRAQQTGHVDIVPTGVHHTRHLRRIFRVVLLLDGQRIHVGPQRHPWSRLAQIAHNASQTHTGLRADTQPSQALGDQGCSAMLLKAQLGMAVDAASQADDHIVQLICTL